MTPATRLSYGIVLIASFTILIVTGLPVLVDGRTEYPLQASPFADAVRKFIEEQGVYNADTGHIGEQDSIINIIQGLEQGRLHDGDLMAIVGAGIGYVWGAACVQWGESKA